MLKICPHLESVIMLLYIEFPLTCAHSILTWSQRRFYFTLKSSTRVLLESLGELKAKIGPLYL